MWYGHKDRHIDQWNRIEGPEINPCIYGQIIFDKDARTSMGKGQSFQHVVLEKLDIHIKEKEVGPLLYIIYKIDSKWIQDLNVRVKL